LTWNVPLKTRGVTVGGKTVSIDVEAEAVAVQSSDEHV
jgi:hypothetical protein